MAIDSLEQGVKFLESGQRVAARVLVERLVTDLVDARQEIQRHHKDFQKWEDMAAKGARVADDRDRLRRLLCLLIPVGWEHSEERPGLRRTYEKCEKALARSLLAEGISMSNYARLAAAVDDDFEDDE